MKLFYLSSKHISGGTNSDFTVTLNRTLSVAEGARFRIDQLRLGVAFMLVNPGNRYIFFQEGPHVGIAILELGQYDSQTLAATLGFVINNSAPKINGNVIVSYSTISGSTTITYTPPASNPTWTFAILTDQQISQISLSDLKRDVAQAAIALSTNAAQNLLAGNANFQSLEAASRVLATLNLNNAQTFNGVLGGYTNERVKGTSVLTFRFISTQPYDTLFLCSHKLGNMSIHGPRGNCTTLMQIVVNAPFGGVQEASMPVNVWISSQGLTCKELDFQLQDARGYVVDMTMGGEISFLLTIDDDQ